MPIDLSRLRLAGLLLGFLATTMPAQAGEPASLTVAYEKAPVLRSFDGVVEAVRQSTVSAQTRGTVLAVNFDVHDMVPKGAVLVRIKDTAQRARLQAAEARLREAEARYHQASKAYDRISRIFARKLVSRSVYDRASANLRAAKARYESARAGVRAAAEELQHTVVRAPYSGIVVKRHIEPGEMAAPGKPLMTGLSLDHLRVQTHIPESYINQVRRFAKVLVIGPGDKRLMTGRMVIFPYADPATHVFRARVELRPGHSGLYPGMMVKVVFQVGIRQQMYVPLSAVVHRGEVTAVYVLSENGRITLRQIRIGQHDGQRRAVVLAGLEPGERVLLDPIAAGVRLKQQRQQGQASR